MNLAALKLQLKLNIFFYDIFCLVQLLNCRQRTKLQTKSYTAKSIFIRNYYCNYQKHMKTVDLKSLHQRNAESLGVQHKGGRLPHKGVVWKLDLRMIRKLCEEKGTINQLLKLCKHSKIWEIKSSIEKDVMVEEFIIISVDVFITNNIPN